MARKLKLLNLYETADKLQVPVGWLKDMALAGKLPCLRVGKRKLRFEPSAVSTAMRKMAAQTPSPSAPSFSLPAFFGRSRAK